MVEEEKPSVRRSRRAGARPAVRSEAADRIAGGLSGLLQEATAPLWLELDALQSQVRELERQLAALQATGGLARRSRGRPPGSRSAAAGARQTQARRIRWGNSEDEIRRTVLAEAARIREQTGKLDVATLRAELPSVFRFLYGDRAVFAGVKGLAAELGS